MNGHRDGPPLPVGLGIAGIFPAVFRAAGRLPGHAPGPAMAAAVTLGYVGFLLGPAAIGFVAQATSLSIALAWFDRKLINILILVVVIALYGAMALGVLPDDPSVSYEAHQAGVVAGILWAYLYAKATRAPRAA